MRCAVYIFVVLTLAGCRGWNVPEFGNGAAEPNVSIGDLRDYYYDEVAGEGAELTIADDIVISGRVVSSDLAGNFYNTFFIDDGTGAVEIMAGMPDLDATYRPGQRVSVRARGLAVGWRDGAMQLGLPPEPGNSFATGYFYHPAVIRAYVSAERDVAPVAPVETSPEALDNTMCGRLVRIEGLGIDPLSTAETWARTLPEPTTGYVKFRLSPADSITVVTSGYASFALAPVPREKVALTGILFYGKGGSSKEHYLLKLRDEKDIAF
jgi:hypothetical protein